MSLVSAVKREMKRYSQTGNFDGFIDLFIKATDGEWGNMIFYNKKSSKKVVKIEKREGTPMMIRVWYETRNSQMLFKNFFNNIELKEWDKWDEIEDEDEDDFDPDFWDRMGVKIT